MNRYFENLEKIEFVITYACTGRCRHCSEGEHSMCGEHIDGKIAAESVRRICSEYNIKTVMTFGGEPLLYADAVYEIMKVARELNVPKRQIITNGYFTKDAEKIKSTASLLFQSGVNDVLLSVDAFHQETIPLEIVRNFAMEIKKCGVPIRLQPAWLVSKTDENPYNIKTREILSSLSDTEIPIGDGNVIFPEGNALKHLAEYFTDNAPINPYEEDPYNVKCVSFSPNGDALNGNIYRRDIMDIIKDYIPE